MTEREAEALAKRLERIWGPMSPITRPGWKLTEELFSFECRVVEDIHIGFERDFAEGITEIEFAMALGNRIPPEMEVPCYMLCVQSDDEEMAWINYDPVPNFNAHYMPLVRRNCFLSGFNIEATAHEKAEWLQDFAQEEREFQVLDERTEWEARRVAAAFGVEEWKRGESHYVFHGLAGGLTHSWVIHQQKFHSLSIQPEGEPTYIFNTATAGWAFRGQRQDILARGLFRLGFDEGGIMSKLPALTEEEKAELRLSMPREFWPKTWLDEKASPGAARQTHKLR